MAIWLIAMSAFWLVIEGFSPKVPEAPPERVHLPPPPRPAAPDTEIDSSRLPGGALRLAAGPAGPAGDALDRRVAPPFRPQASGAAA
ncbi:MAG: hypothetical protein GC201_06635 [Alphaproteobacteria bacterium]|nr:hypothetical protein [Alphaproteobacteria bacterium]